MPRNPTFSHTGTLLLFGPNRIRGHVFSMHVYSRMWNILDLHTVLKNDNFFNFFNSIKGAFQLEMFVSDVVFMDSRIQIISWAFLKVCNSIWNVY